jgi:cytochrome c
MYSKPRKRKETMKRTAALLPLTALIACAPALADQALATSKNCMACHAVDKKLVGPAYQDIAKKYAGDATAQAKLETKVKKGGSGVWGPVPMPPNVAVKDEDIKTLVKWVLAGAK